MPLVRRLWRYWPIVIFTATGFGDADWSIPLHRFIERTLHIDIITYYFLLITASSAEMIYQFWFFGWCRHLISKEKTKYLEKIVAKIQVWTGKNGAMNIVSFITGIIPIPGFRFPTLVLTRTLDAYGAFTLLVIGNCIRLYFMLRGYDKTLSILNPS